MARASRPSNALSDLVGDKIAALTDAFLKAGIYDAAAYKKFKEELDTLTDLRALVGPEHSLASALTGLANLGRDVQPQTSNVTISEASSKPEEGKAPRLFLGDALVSRIAVDLSQDAADGFDAFAGWKLWGGAQGTVVLVDEAGVRMLSLVSWLRSTIRRSTKVLSAFEANGSDGAERELEEVQRGIEGFVAMEQDAEAESEAGLGPLAAGAAAAIHPAVAVAALGLDLAFKYLPALKSKVDIVVQDAELDQETLHTAFARGLIHGKSGGRWAVIDCYSLPPWLLSESDTVAAPSLVSLLGELESHAATLRAIPQKANAPQPPHVHTALAQADELLKMPSLSGNPESPLSFATILEFDRVCALIEQCEAERLFFVEVAAIVKGAATVKESRPLWWRDVIDVEASVSLTVRASTRSGELVYADLLTRSDMTRHVFGRKRRRTYSAD